MLNSNAINLEEFFSRGFSVSELDPRVSAELLKVAEDCDFFQPDGTNNPREATWEDSDKKLPLYNNPPDKYKGFGKMFSRHPYFSWFTELYGDFNHTNIMLQLCEKGQEMSWHWDLFDAVPVVNMIYLSPDDIEDCDGGGFEVGRCSINKSSGTIDYDREIEKLASIIPKHGTVVTINNTNPLFCHKVSKMLADKKRYTMIVQMGYKENVINSKMEKNIASGNAILRL